MYEMYTFGKVPYTTMNHDEVLVFLQEGKRLERPEDMPENLYEIVTTCWMEKPEERLKI